MDLFTTTIVTAVALTGAAVVRGIRETSRKQNNKAEQMQLDGNSPSPSLIKDEKINVENAVADDPPCGLGGWLILIGIGIISDPLVSLFFVLSFFSDDGLIVELAKPELQTEFPLFSPFMYGAMIINGLLVVAWIVAIYLFFTKKAVFPKWYIGTSILSLILIVPLFIGAHTIFHDLLGDTSVGDQSNIVFRIIFIRYMMVSKRVKATFVR